MKKNESILVFILRLFLSFVLLFVAFWFFDPVNALQVEADSISMLNFGLYVPLVFISFTIISCLIVGLPIRLMTRLNEWWHSNFIWQMILLIVGILLMFLSLHSRLRIENISIMNDETRVNYLSNTLISLPGWFLTTFSILHLDLSDASDYITGGTFFGKNWTSSSDR